jgi:GDP-4-dehydro-6-deoxy-D-mannose reductase
VDRKNIPLKEDAPLNPASPYAVARVSQEMVSRIYSRGYGLPIICTRSFNHIGPRQREIFAVSSFAKQAAEAKKGIRNHILCGDIDIIRDFIDVRDAVRAYDILLQRGTAGEVYNVCSGQGHSLSEIIEMLKNIAGLDMTVRKDPSLIRPVDNPMIIGSCDKLKKEVSFSMSYDIKDSLADVLAYWEDHV